MVCICWTTLANNSTTSDYVMYLSTKLPMALNALFRPLASEFIPAVAANATSARIKTYSTRPCPDSSLCKRAKEFKTKLFIDILLRFSVSDPSAFGGPRWVSLACLSHVHRQMRGHGG